MKYRTIVVDPPWKFDQPWKSGYLAYRSHSPGNPSSPNEGRKLARGAAAKYAVVELAEIEALPIREWAEDNAHLYLWATNSHLRAAFGIMEAWGFTYKTTLTWCKNKIGMGRYYRNSTEHVLFGVRGSLMTQRRDVWTHFNAERHKHSEKPAAFYDMVQTMSPGPYLDVFARKPRFFWDCWGDEVGAPKGLPTPDQVRARRKEGSA